MTDFFFLTNQTRNLLQLVLLMCYCNLALIKSIKLTAAATSRWEESVEDQRGVTLTGVHR